MVICPRFSRVFPLFALQLNWKIQSINELKFRPIKGTRQSQIISSLYIGVHQQHTQNVAIERHELHEKSEC